MREGDGYSRNAYDMLCYDAKAGADLVAIVRTGWRCL